MVDMMQLSEIKILLVEDSDSDTEIALRAFLKTHLPYRVLRLRDGDEALEFLFRTGRFEGGPSKQPSLILLDLSLPKTAGIEVLRRLKQSTVTQDIKVFVLTGSQDTGAREECLRLGADGYLMKPLTTEAYLSLATGLKLDEGNST